MSGAHRAPPESPAITTAKAVRSWAPLAVLLIGVPGLLGLIIWLLVIATNLERFSALSLAFAGLLIWSIADRSAYGALLAAGALMAMASGLVKAIGEARDWPNSQVHQIAVLGDWLQLPEVACIAIACAILVWRGNASRPGLRRRFRPPSPPTLPRL